MLQSGPGRRAGVRHGGAMPGRLLAWVVMPGVVALPRAALAGERALERQAEQVEAMSSSEDGPC